MLRTADNHDTGRTYHAFIYLLSGTMRIAFCSDSLPPITDGVARTLSHLVRTLVDTGTDFRFVSPFTPNDGAWRGRVFKVGSVPFPLYNYYRLGLGNRRVARAVQAFRPDVMHVVSPTPLGWWGRRLARQLNVPVVTSYHTHFVSYLPYYRLSKLQGPAWAYLQEFHRGFARTYAPSREACTTLRKRGIRGVELWPRGIDTERFSPRFRSDDLRRQYGVDENTPLLVFVGRLVREKDLPTLLDAYARLRARQQRFRLALVGDGPMRREIAQQHPGIILPGFQSGDDLASWYASADIFVFPSTTETFGNVVVEAQVSGVAPVVAGAGGVTDIVRHGINGLVTKPRCSADLTTTIERLLNDVSLRQRLSRQAREDALMRDWCRVNENLLRSYTTVIREHAVLPTYSRQRRRRSLAPLTSSVHD